MNKPKNATIYNSEFYATQIPDSSKSAQLIVPLVVDMIRPQSVVDVGCGVGTWLIVFQQYGVKRVLGLDGDYVSREALLIDEKDFYPVDLRQPFHLDATFDLAVSLEVGEHIPPKNAKDFVASIARLSPVVLFSAAIPWQGGVEHINCQWPVYWQALFAQHGFAMFDPIRKLIMSNKDIVFWYRQNIFMYAQNELINSDPKINRLVSENPISDLAMVKQDYLLSGFGIRQSLRYLLKAIKGRFFRR
jgi:SAM-dependent methyltransferase